MAKKWHEKYQHLLFEEKEHGILLMTINRPEQMNATDAVLHNALSKVWLDIDDDADVRVVIVTGAGRAFSAGGDLSWVSTIVNN